MPLRVEDRLQFPESAVNPLSEQHAVPVAARDPVPVLPAHRALELHHQVLHGRRYVGHFPYPGWFFQVDDRADVQASDRSVAVIPGARVVPLQNPAKTPHIIAEVFRIDGGVLHECDRLCVAPHAAEQAQPCLADRPDIGLIRRPFGVDEGVSHPVRLQSAVQLREPRSDLLSGLAVEFDDQDCLRVAFDERHLLRESRLQAGQVEKHPVDKLDRCGLHGQDFGQRLQGCDEIVKMEDVERSGGGLGLQIQRRLRAGDERALAPGNQAA